MAFDALTILRGKNNADPAVLVDLESTEEQAVLVTPNADGAYVVDLKKTGKQGVAIVVVCPTVGTYAKTLAVLIEESDFVGHGFQTLVTFPTLYTYVRKLKFGATYTDCVAADIGKNAVATGGTGDDGTLIAYDNTKKEWLVAMTADGDVFDAAETVEVTTDGGTGTGTTLGASTLLVPQPIPNAYIRRIVTNKRYIRGKYTATAGGNFGKVQVLVGGGQLNRL